MIRGPNIRRDQITFNRLTDLLGSGQYAKVYKAHLKCMNDQHKTIAVKESRNDGDKHNVGKAKNELLSEAKLMEELYHPHIVKFLGISEDDVLLICLEYCRGGSLDKHLVMNGATLRTDELIEYTAQAASGLDFLHSRRIIHKDVAARNYLLTSQGTIKLSDFGMSKKLGDLDSIFDSNNGTNIPLRWFAPECLQKPLQVFSPKSDIWAFVVFLYEIFNNGIPPWQDQDEFPDRRIKSHIKQCRIPSMPPRAPQCIQCLTRSIWVINPSQRPTMKSIIALINSYKNDVEQPPVMNPAPLNLTELDDTWLPYRVGDPWPHNQKVQALGKRLDTIPGVNSEQFVSVYYHNGEAVMGRIFNERGKIAANFGSMGHEFTKDIDIQVLLYSRGLDYQWKSFPDACMFEDNNREEIWRPVHINHIAPAVLTIHGKQILGQISFRNGTGSSGFGGKEHTITEPAVSRSFVLCKRIVEKKQKRHHPAQKPFTKKKYLQNKSTSRQSSQ